MDRDPRRKFTAAQARYLNERARGLCEGCGGPLPPDWQSHHVIAHSRAGPTVVQNGRALCLECHRELHGMSTFEPRKWQTECHQQFCDELLIRGGANFVIEACPGAGKSAMAAWFAHSLLRDDTFQERFQIDHVIALVPWASIQGSPIGPRGPTGMCKAFIERGLAVRTQLLIPGLRASQPRPTAFDVSVVTYQAALNPQVLEAIRLWRREAGDWRFAIVMDEIHHTRSTGGGWGEMVAQLRSEATVAAVMSGTYFRGDGHPIQFLDYESGRPRANYRYTYTTALLDQCVRPVAFRRIDATFSAFDADADKVVAEGIELRTVDRPEHLAMAKRKVLDPDSDCVRSMVRDAHSDLMRTRAKFPKAGCLIVCQPGTSDDGEDRHVEKIAALVERETGHVPVVLTHHDPEDVTDAKLADFRAGSAPYLVAVNMVSEGCDIPRLRSVVFCRYTESEMLFRQIVGRVLRREKDDDGTAATVYLPAFPLMRQFADNLEGDCLEALKELNCRRCDCYPCVCTCPACSRPKSECVCLRPEDGDKPMAPKLIAVDLVATGGGGAIGGKQVGEGHIQFASDLITQNPFLAGCNKVQIGFVIQTATVAPAVEPPPVDHVANDLERVSSRIKRAISRFAATKYAHLDHKHRFSTAWTEEFTCAYGIKFSEATQQWSVSRLEEAADALDRRAAVEARKPR